MVRAVSSLGAVSVHEELIARRHIMSPQEPQSSADLGMAKVMVAMGAVIAVALTLFYGPARSGHTC